VPRYAPGIWVISFFGEAGSSRGRLFLIPGRRRFSAAFLPCSSSAVPARFPSTACTAAAHRPERGEQTGSLGFRGIQVWKGTREACASFASGCAGLRTASPSRTTLRAVAITNCFAAPFCKGRKNM
jgi:hypothetical protein